MKHRNLPPALSTAKKILVSGAFATGKTTLCNRVADRLVSEGRSVTILSETPRRCPFALNKDQTPLASAWLLGEQIRSEVEVVVSEPELVICDRGIPDIVSHTTILEVAGRRDQDLKTSLLDLARSWCRTYDIVFWALLDPHEQIESDGVRVADKRYQEFLEASIEEAFRLLSLSPLILPGANAERVEAMRKSIEELIAGPERTRIQGAVR